MKRYSVAAAIAAGLVLAGGAAYAAIPAAGGTITACSKTDGGLRVVDAASACRSSETSLAWNQTGPAGPAGPAGPQGEAGPAGPQGPAGTSATGYGVWGSVQDVSEGASVAVVTTSLSAGAYVLFAAVDIGVDGTTVGAGPDVVCWLAQDGVLIADAAETVAVNPAPIGTFFGSSTLALTATMTATAPSIVTLRCAQSGAADVDFEADLTAVGVGSIG